MSELSKMAIYNLANEFFSQEEFNEKELKSVISGEQQKVEFVRWFELQLLEWLCDKKK